MFTQASTLIDTCARKNNFLSRIDARTKMAFVLLSLILNILLPGIVVPLGLAILSLALLLTIRMPGRLLLLRLTIPLTMAAVLLVTQVFLTGSTPLFHMDIAGLSITGYVEGLKNGILTVGRVLAGVSLILLLSMSTPADKLFKAALWFRVPTVVIEISLLIYRYIFVMGDELMLMQSAQQVRLGYHNWRQSMKSVSTLGACLILRAYDRAERVFESMLVRGYGQVQPTPEMDFSWEDGCVALLMGLILAGFYFIGQATA